MVFVALECPVCNAMRAYNGRGRCRCGTYLIHHAARPFYFDPCSDVVYDMSGQEPRRLAVLDCG